jgi:hypothetical protein
VDPEQYPRTYLIDVAARRVGDVMATAPLAVVIAVVFFKLAGLAGETTALLATAAIALSSYGRTHRRVILYEDRIEVSGWFSSRKLKRSEILDEWRRVYGSVAEGIVTLLSRWISPQK